MINKWNLNNKVYMIVTDKGANVVKGIELLKDNYLVEVCRQHCAAYTLQLSIKEELKQVSHIHQRFKNIQAFFRLPKQAQQLREMQIKHISESQGIDNNNRLISPLEILSDSTSLQYKLDSISKKDREKLDQLCLNFEEKKSLLNSSNQDTSISSGDEDSIPLAENRKQWQYAHRTKCAIELDDTNTIKYLPSTNYKGLLEKKSAAIYLSPNKLWGIPDETGLKASILDLRVLKLLPFATNEECKNTEIQLCKELLVLI
ncbi:hypothetical protein C2G38_2207612 [Gigaspora rosea]|uniref:DUF659 domain-containing protein n=1 Tax=Gigaspora rosea TaxID=44941 RepID=A0A397UHV1_9GLOM|nr:hypothetical protein C2G38_2207612 [Gigaspora rosea]